MSGKQYWKILLLCFVSALGNYWLTYFVAGFPLYLDVVFTAAICFAFGFVPGILTGVLLFPSLGVLLHIYVLRAPVEHVFFSVIFTICVFIEIILICYFRKKMRQEETVFLEKPSFHSFIALTPQLLTLTAIACIAVSFAGGVIDFTLTQVNIQRPYSPEDTFMLGLLRNNVPFLASAILSRIPINIVSRFVIIFGGFGLSILYRKIVSY